MRFCSIFTEYISTLGIAPSPFPSISKHHTSLTRAYSIIMHLLSLFAFTSGLLSATLATKPVTRSVDTASVLHFTLTRRGGKFAPTEFALDYVNLTFLAQELEKTEDRFKLTQREVKGNKLIRKAKSNEVGGRDSNSLMGEVAAEGIW